MPPFLPNERVALFIDGANLYSASRNLGFDVDYRNLLKYFKEQANVIRAYYYSAVLETEEYSPLKPLTDWLAYNGYALVTKPAKEFTDATGRRRVKGNMDIEIAVDMLEIADRVDHIVLFSGDSDFRRLVEAVQRKGVRVTVVSSVTPARRWWPTNCAASATIFWNCRRSRPSSPAAKPNRASAAWGPAARPPNRSPIRTTPPESGA